MLVALGGLPGVGKTTLGRRLAGRLPGAHVRIDAFEAALASSGLLPITHVGAMGYTFALAAADTCLAAGTDVVVDAVFPVAESREPWTELAARHGTTIRWVRLVCTDTGEHRRRVTGRRSDLPGLVVPGWDDVVAREVDDWAEPHAVVDTASGDPLEPVSRLLS